MTDKLPIFIHIPKSGGTTLSSIIRANLGPLDIQDHESLGGRPQRLEDLSSHQKAHVRGVMGHYYYGVHEHFPDRIYRYFTMLRRPIERVVSSYSFLRNYPGYEPVRDMTITQFVDSYPEANDLQTRMLAGLHDCDERGWYRSHLDKALANMETFSGVGVTERFAESVLLIGEELGWTDLNYTVENVTPNRLSVAALSADDVEYIRAANRLDEILYRRACQMLDDKLSALDADARGKLTSCSADDERG